LMKARREWLSRACEGNGSGLTHRRESQAAPAAQIRDGVEVQIDLPGQLVQETQVAYRWMGEFFNNGDAHVLPNERFGFG
jgi:hypothetical protein